MIRLRGSLVGNMGTETLRPNTASRSSRLPDGSTGGPLKSVMWALGSQDLDCIPTEQ